MGGEGHVIHYCFRLARVACCLCGQLPLHTHELGYCWALYAVFCAPEDANGLVDGRLPWVLRELLHAFLCTLQWIVVEGVLDARASHAVHCARSCALSHDELCIFAPPMWSRNVTDAKSVLCLWRNLVLTGVAALACLHALPEYIAHAFDGIYCV